MSSTETLLLAGDPLHLRLRAGDDRTITCTFTTPADIVGWTGWRARVKSGTTTWDLTVDATNQATGVITVEVTDTQSTAMFGKPSPVWQFRADDANSKPRTIFYGNVTVLEDEYAV